MACKDRSWFERSELKPVRKSHAGWTTAVEDWRWGDGHLADCGEEILPTVWSLKPHCVFLTLTWAHGLIFFFFWRHKSDLITGKSRDLISCWISSLQPATFCKRPAIKLSARRDGRAALTRYLPDRLIAFNGYYKMLWNIRSPISVWFHQGKESWGVVIWLIIPT